MQKEILIPIWRGWHGARIATAASHMRLLYPDFCRVRWSSEQLIARRLMEGGGRRGAVTAPPFGKLQVTIAGVRANVIT